MTTNTLLAVDGNSLVHRSFHALASSKLATSDGRPTWAVKGFLSQLLGAVERAGASAVVVGFDDHTSSIRKEAHPHYKAQRSPKPPELGQQISSVIDLLRSAGIAVVVPAGLEADDVLASAAAFAPTKGWRTVVVTSDRDSFALIDEHTSVLRVINGGIEASPLLTPQRLQTMLNIPPALYQQYAALRGDTSDNLPGVRGVGEVTAAKLLGAFGSVQEAFDDVNTNGGQRVTQVLGKSFVKKLADPQGRQAYTRNVQIMAMHRDISLGLDLTRPDGAGMLPLASQDLAAALDRYELVSLRRPAQTVLCGGWAQSSAPVPVYPQADVEQDGFTSAQAPEPDRLPPAVPSAPALVSSGAMRGSTAPRPQVWVDVL